MFVGVIGGMLRCSHGGGPGRRPELGLAAASGYNPSELEPPASPPIGFYQGYQGYDEILFRRLL